MVGLDRKGRCIVLAPVTDDAGQEVLPRRLLQYDTLVLALGAVANTFGISGVTQSAFGLESAGEAERFHHALINGCLRADYAAGSDAPAHLRVVIVGGGATGVELAAELHNTTRTLAAYGLRNINPDRHIRIELINADERILPMLPQRISVAAQAILAGLGVQVLCGQQVTSVTSTGVMTRTGRAFEAELVVWAAGIKAPVFLRGIDGLETNRLDQVVVGDTLQSTRDPDIFAMGDCSSCPDLRPGRTRAVPATAQAAHQQSRHLFDALQRRLDGRELLPFRYRDFGSLVSLGEYTTVGTLMGFISGRSFWIEGAFARLMYITLYRQHLYALHGFRGVVMDALAHWFRRRTRPRVKLH